MQILLTAEQIRDRVRELGARISADHPGQALTIVGVLTGCLIFLADLVRSIDLPLRIALIQASSYRGATTTASTLHIQPELLPDLHGRHVLLVDDILDTGHTISRLAAQVQAMAPASLRVAVLLRKRGRQVVPFEPDYAGFDIPDQFVVGYGLDFNDGYRNLPYVAVLPDDAAGG